MTDPGRESGDGSVQAEINAHYRRIYKLCLFYLGDPQEAEDAAQAAFEKIWLHRDRFSGQSAVYTWMYRIAVNTALNALRRRKLLRWLSLEAGGDLAPLEGCGQPVLSPPEQLERRQERELQMAGLERALQRMSGRERTAFYLFHYERLRQRDIAEVMGTSLSAVESLIHKAMAKVRREMAGK